MDSKKSILILSLLLAMLQMEAQSHFGLSIATSKNDRHMETLWYQQQLSERFSAGIQLRYSSINYRFVNARAIEQGSTVFAGAVLGFNLKKSENFRLDFNVTASYRYLNNEENEDLPSSTNGLEIDPNFIFGLKLTDNVLFHSGAMLRNARQFGEEPIPNEQLPSAIVLSGLSIHKEAHTVSVRAYAGPMNGATGDTEKFFWQFSLGYQYTLGAKNPLSIPFFNF